jgi:hypothetical protein
MRAAYTSTSMWVQTLALADQAQVGRRSSSGARISVRSRIRTSGPNPAALGEDVWFPGRGP